MSEARRMKSPSARPVAKVEAGAAAGALAVVLVWVLGLCDVDVPAETSSAITALLATAVAYLTPPRGADRPVVDNGPDA